MYPVAHVGAFAGCRFTLSNFVFMVWKQQILATMMDIELRAQPFAGHGRALDMPPRAPFAPRAVPRGLTGLSRLPEREIKGVSFPFAHIHSGACFVVLKCAMRQAAVAREAFD